METIRTAFTLQPYTVKDLADLYGVHRNTFARWLYPFENEIGIRKGYYFNIKQVKIIVDKLGTPGTIED
ncbi:MAG TPA: hypothetical protein VM802_10245 [Chitinophaga sp.]|uniref:hypothetical protein n=1 Tax=Chitinophaga sp. TaxID=1869181 RepID=UPI002D0B0266|nr:hypothetical protein [Chitinophaga sp.]HVI45243.1 hypothetical protein [Chitinophaga sp.]